MTLHAAKGLEFDTVFLPGWEEGLFPHSARSTRRAAPASRKSAASPMSASPAPRRRAKICFAANRRMHGLWQTAMPSRFLDELPEAHVEVTEAQGGFGGYGGYGASRFDATTSFGTTYATPGWQRAQAKRDRDGFADNADDDYEPDRGSARRRGFVPPLPCGERPIERSSIG